MNQTRIFVSYTGRDEISKQVSKRLFDRLNAEGFAAWRDQERLQHGEKWHDQLTKNLVGSHASVVLLSKEALKSEWVLKEATYLKVRTDGSPDYKVVTILLDGLSPSDLNADGCAFKVLDFPADQLIHHSEDSNLDRVSKALLEVRSLWEAVKPEDNLIGSVQVFLKKLDQEILLRLARHLELELQDWFPDGSMKETLARELARLMTASKPHKVAQALGKVVEHINLNDAKGILQCINPFQVDGDGARMLAQVAGLSAPGAAAGLNTNEREIGVLYMRRASGTLEGWQHVEVNALYDPERGGEDLVREVRHALANELCPSLEDEEELEEELKDVLDGNTYFIIIPGAVSEEVLRRLQDRFDRLRFLVLSSRLSPDSPLCRCDSFRFLRPPLKEGDDTKILNLCKRALADLKKRYDQLQASSV